MEIQRVGVLGGGMMGAGIIYTLSSSSLAVVFEELNEDLLRRCSDQVNNTYAAAFNKGKMTEHDMEKGLASITGKMDYKGFERCDMVIERCQKRSLLRE